MMQEYAGRFLSQTLRDRHTLRQKAEKEGESVEDFVTRFPQHRLYQMADNAPYAYTKSGALVLVTEYNFELLKDPEPEEQESVRVKLIRHPNGKWEDGHAYWIAPKYLKRVDEEEFGIEIET